MTPVVHAAAAATSAPPWWGNGLFTVIGLVIGGSVVQLFSVYNERRKHERTRELTREQVNRELTGELLASAQSYVRSRNAEEARERQERCSFALTSFQVTQDPALIDVANNMFRLLGEHVTFMLTLSPNISVEPGSELEARITASVTNYMQAEHALIEAIRVTNGLPNYRTVADDVEPSEP